MELKNKRTATIGEAIDAFVGLFSTNNTCVSNSQTMRNAMQIIDYQAFTFK